MAEEGKSIIDRSVMERWPTLTLCTSLSQGLIGCSRTVSWQEEVPLNTGETIRVKRATPTQER